MMNPYETYKYYKEEKNFIPKFLKQLNIIHSKKLFFECDIEAGHTYETKNQYSSGKAVCAYPYGVKHIYSLDKYFHHGLITSLNQEYISEDEFLQLPENDQDNLFENEFNDVSIGLEFDNISFDNYKEKISFSFSMNGGLNDFGLLNHRGYYVVLDAFILNSSLKNQWGELILQGISLQAEERYDIAFLVLFSAFDNFVNLEIEKISKYYHSEFAIERLEFGKKVRILLKHYDNQEDVLNFVYNIYSELYDYRNQVAHGSERNIEKEECDKCFDLFVFMYLAISNKLSTKNDLYREAKSISQMEMI